jgi:hypothetical protein
MDTQLVEHALSMPPSLKMAEKGKHPLKYIQQTILFLSVANTLIRHSVV